MAINRESNSYTIIFSVIMVIVVGTILAGAAIALKPFQEKNIKNEKMQNILSAIQVKVDRDEAPDNFNKYVKKRILIDAEGNIVSTKEGEIDKFDKVNEPFNIDVKKKYKSGLSLLVKQYKDDESTLTSKLKEGEYTFPLFICEKDGNEYTVIPMVGTGLWGPVWGYVALQNDYNTIYGASFDHKTETPGLGAEIKEGIFTDQFPGKKILNASGNVSIEVIKAGQPNTDNTVSGITGGTITSQGVGEMMTRTFKVYNKYFKKIKN